MTQAVTREVAEPLAPAAVPAPAAPAARWLRRLAWLNAVADATAVALGVLVAHLVAFGSAPAALSGVPYFLLGVLGVPAWVAVLCLSGAYDRRILGSGPDEYRRVGLAGVHSLAGLAMLVFALNLDIARSFVAVGIPLAAGLTVLGRFSLRKGLHHHRRHGRFTHRVVVLGSREEAEELTRHLHQSSHAGFSVVGACLPDTTPLDIDGDPIPIFGPPFDVLTAVSILGADAIAVAGTAYLDDGGLRRLAWQLEGSGIELIVAPAVTDVAGPRISIRPVAGLPLLHVDEPRLGGATRAILGISNRALAAAALVMMAPVLLAVAAMVRLTSPGPAFFRQVRIGLTGRPFTVWKFRTMRTDAEAVLASLQHLNEHHGPLFKIRNDPRLSGLGRWLRRFSVDELPQLWNVVRGEMLIVGPRPPLPSEVANFTDAARRRLLVKPGLTGLWQVSGRSDLSWEESVRLDLHYVENWSLALDVSILWKTVRAVLLGRGAY